MASGLRQFAEGILITMVFGLFILLFVTQFLGNTNPDSEVLINYGGALNNSATSFNSSINNFTSQMDTFKSDLGGAEPGLGQFLFLIFEGAFSIPRAFLGMVYTGAISLVNTLFLFGGGGWGGIFTITASIILVVMLLRLILYIIQTIRTGQSER